VPSIYRGDIKENVAAVALETGWRGTSADKAHPHPGDARLSETAALRKPSLANAFLVGWI